MSKESKPVTKLKVTMKRSEIVAMYNGIQQLAKSQDILTAAYIAHNKRTALLPVVQDIQEISTPKEDFQEYEDKRLKVCHKYAEKDDKGQFKMDGAGSFVFGEKSAEAHTALEALAVEHKDMLDAAKKRQKEVADYLSGEEEVEFRMIGLSSIARAFKDVSPDSLTCIMAMVDMDS